MIQPATALLLAQSPHGGPALGALIIGLVWGILLLGFGAALLRPMVVLAALIAGTLLGVAVARAWTPEVPLWAAAALGAVLGVAAGALLYRFTVATISAVVGAVGAVAGALVAWAIMAGGALDAQPRALDHAFIASHDSSTHGDGARSSQAILDIVTAPAAQGTSADTTLTTGDRVLRDLSTLTTTAAARTQASLQATPAAYRTLLSGLVLTGAVVGMVAGLIATTMVARILTSLAGAGLTLFTALPLLAYSGHPLALADARAWLAATASLALIGVTVQCLLAGGSAASKRPTRAKRAKPAAAEAAAA